MTETSINCSLSLVSQCAGPAGVQPVQMAKMVAPLQPARPPGSQESAGGASRGLRSRGGFSPSPHVVGTRTGSLPPRASPRAHVARLRIFHFGGGKESDAPHPTPQDPPRASGRGRGRARHAAGSKALAAAGQGQTRGRRRRAQARVSCPLGPGEEQQALSPGGSAREPGAPRGRDGGQPREGRRDGGAPPPAALPSRPPPGTPAGQGLQPPRGDPGKPSAAAAAAAASPVRVALPPALSAASAPPARWSSELGVADPGWQQQRLCGASGRRLPTAAWRRCRGWSRDLGLPRRRRRPSLAGQQRRTRLPRLQAAAGAAVARPRRPSRGPVGAALPPPPPALAGAAEQLAEEAASAGRGSLLLPCSLPPNR
ncbi:collagen alpha-1(I) chain-like [Elgaria multicarinata webbii]|uniref:collagen alpha-1(I) chain-like n=1 Tax=Elgaria multicarinata webbii TaxID=159646 RepID=UPI002FCD66C6